MERTIDVDGMACTGCERTVETELAELAGVTNVEADHERDTVTVIGDADSDRLAAAVREAGYEVTD